VVTVLPSVLWQCCLAVRKSIHPVKGWVMRCWHGYLSGARCKWFACDPADATTTPSSLALLKSRFGLTFPGADCPGKEAVKRVSVLLGYYLAVKMHRKWCLILFLAKHVRYLLSPICLSSVCLSVICNVRAPYSGGSNFWQYFYGFRYLGHPLTSTENFTEIVPEEPLRQGS